VSPSLPVGIRSAAAADLPALTRLCGELGYASDPGQVQRRFARVAADPEHHIFVAEDASGRVLGWVHVHLTKLLESDLRGEVAGMIVAPEARGRGVGRRLMQAAEAWTKGRGGAQVSLRCNLVRTEAHAFYERLGYKVAKTQLNFRKPV
jgi:GNAT superfamily N-acetyltransferase